MQISSKFTIAVHLLAVIDYLGDNEKVTSNILAKSIGSNPVIVRNVMGNLKESGIIDISQGKSGVLLTRKTNEITFYDVYKAVESVKEEGLFHFHENPNPECPIGSNIHKAMDIKLETIQQSMEEEMKKITIADVLSDIMKEIKNIG
jgi:hypothetical protein